MKYHNITKQDMNNGEGLRVVLWVSGCEHHCKGCQNPITWDIDSGVVFDSSAVKEILYELSQDWCSGLTLSGGDPLHTQNRQPILVFCKLVKALFPTKTIWCYTGYLWEDIVDLPVMQYLDVVIDGKYNIMQNDINYKWAGSTNQRIIDVQKSLSSRSIVLYESS